jgi:hypothetical protein
MEDKNDYKKKVYFRKKSRNTSGAFKEQDSGNRNM